MWNKISFVWIIALILLVVNVSAQESTDNCTVGLNLYLKFNDDLPGEVTDTIVVDSSASVNSQTDRVHEGVVDGAIFDSSDKKLGAGSYLFVRGETDRIIIAHNKSLHEPTHLSICLWVKPTSLPSDKKVPYCQSGERCEIFDKKTMVRETKGYSPTNKIPRLEIE